MSEAKYIRLSGYQRWSEEEMRVRATSFLVDVQRRRSVREFSDRPIPREVIEACLRAAGTAPSGANMQPWHFVVVEDSAVKREIRQASEREERQFYGQRASQPWLDALVPLGTTPDKPFLERAPYLVAVFIQYSGRTAEGEKTKHYYPKESVGIATGILITALHHAGLVSLTYTPSRMAFLNEILDRPENERPMMILVVGHPAEDAIVPEIRRKTLDEFVTFV